MEDLIKELNSPENQSSPGRVQEIQRSIQQLQREKSGWQKGFELLKSHDQISRFYGALTLTIKINTDWATDGFDGNEQAREELLEGLISAYVQLANAPDAPFVLLKLCSAITAYFVKDDTWQTSLRQVFISLLQGQYVPSESVANNHNLIQSLLSMNFHQLRGALWFASTLVEDVSRLDTGTSRSAALVERLASNSEDVWLAMKVSLDSFIIGTTSKTLQIARVNLLEVEAIEIVKIVQPMVLPWLDYLPPDDPEEEALGHSVIDLAHGCVATIFACFANSVLQDLTIETLTNVAQSCYQIFRHTGEGAVAGIITSLQATVWIDEMEQGEFSSEAVRYVEFLIALINSEDLSSPGYLEDDTVLANLSTLKRLMHCDGTAVIEDEACQLVLECLNELVEQYNEWSVDTQGNHDMRPFITEICVAAIAKSKYPMTEVDASTSKWDADDRAKFQDFRNDVTDFLAAAFVTLGSPLIEALARSAISNNPDSYWPKFEVGLFCLFEFSDTMEHEAEQYDPIVHAILQSSQWATITQQAGNRPSKVRQTAIKFIAQQTGYLRRNVDFLIPCLDFLFHSLQDPGSAQAASRAIQKLCFSERTVLVEALPQFLGSLTSWNALEADLRQRVYSAIAAIVQALPNEQDKVEPIAHILQAAQSIWVATSPEQVDISAEEKVDVPVRLLETLAAIGKGLRAPSDLIIDLEASQSDQASFWISGPGQSVQWKALEMCVSTLRISGIQDNAEIVEAACDFVKSGYTEADPSPFKFSAAVSVDFITSQIRTDSPNIDAVMSCASTFLASTDRAAMTTLFPQLLDPIFSCFNTIMTVYKSTNSLPEGDFPASSIDFLTRLLPKWSSSLLGIPNAQERWAVTFDLALTILAASDTLPRRSAASFFAAIFELMGHSPSLTRQASDQFSKVLSIYAKPVIALTLKLLAGECARSEIEAVTEILRKLVSKQIPATRRLLKEAMTEDSDVLSTGAYAATTVEQRLRFIAQAESLRGARKTIAIAKDFWVACRGDAFGYVT